MMYIIHSVRTLQFSTLEMESQAGIQEGVMPFRNVNVRKLLRTYTPEDTVLFSSFINL
jgi:hypothetical protein